MSAGNDVPISGVEAAVELEAVRPGPDVAIKLFSLTVSSRERDPNRPSAVFFTPSVFSAARAPKIEMWMPALKPLVVIFRFPERGFSAVVKSIPTPFEKSPRSSARAMRSVPSSRVASEVSVASLNQPQLQLPEAIFPLYFEAESSLK